MKRSGLFVTLYIHVLLKGAMPPNFRRLITHCPLNRKCLRTRWQILSAFGAVENFTVVTVTVEPYSSVAALSGDERNSNPRKRSSRTTEAYLEGHASECCTNRKGLQELRVRNGRQASYCFSMCVSVIRCRFLLDCGHNSTATPLLHRLMSDVVSNCVSANDPAMPAHFLTSHSSCQKGGRCRWDRFRGSA